MVGLNSLLPKFYCEIVVLVSLFLLFFKKGSFGFGLKCNSIKGVDRSRPKYKMGQMDQCRPKRNEWIELDQKAKLI